MDNLQPNIHVMDYACSLGTTLDQYNRLHSTKILQTDVKILRVLKHHTRGMRSMAIKREVHPNGTPNTYTDALDRLVSLHFISRTKHRTYVLYTITLKGIGAYNEMGDIMLVNLYDYMMKIADNQQLKTYAANRTRQDYNPDYTQQRKARERNKQDNGPS